MPNFKDKIKPKGTGNFMSGGDIPIGGALEAILIDSAKSQQYDNFNYRIYIPDQHAIKTLNGTTVIDSAFQGGLDDGTIKPGDYFALRRDENTITNAGRTLLNFELYPAEDDDDVIAWREEAENLLAEKGETAPWLQDDNDVSFG